jgi:DNA-binding response OmpR family regulator
MTKAAASGAREPRDELPGRRLCPPGHTLFALLGESACDLAAARLLSPEFRLVDIAHGRDRTVVSNVERPALILLSADLLRSSLADACGSLRNGVENRRVPIIVISSAAEPNDALCAFTAGADDFLVLDPFRPVQLRTRVRLWLMRAAAA